MERASIESAIRDSIQVKQAFLGACVPPVLELTELALACLEKGGKLLLFGNGGSSCDAAHAAGELVGWFEDRGRPAIPAIALGHEVPTLTAVANDSSYEAVFTRQLEALARPEDLAVGISTSGNSPNVVAALRRARELGLRTALLGSERKGAAVEFADVSILVPSANTARIQECHLLTVHLLCGVLETRWAARAR